MGTKIKGIYKSFKYISQIFVVKEREMDIGYPTDVKHVAHIGWDGHSGNSPSWMNGLKTGPEFATASIGNSGFALSPWSSSDFGSEPGSEVVFKDVPPRDLPNIPKKPKRKKVRSNTSSPNSSSTSRASRAAKSKIKFVEGNAAPANIEVA